MTVDGEAVTFTYDASGNPQTVTYGGNTYYYTVNIQGDVTGIVDESGAVLVRYNYHSYGATYYYAVSGAIGSTLRQINPLTYRGYVYDHETGLYYLQSRYYSPKTGRFLNADALVTTGQGLLGNNMFAYCLNNPVMCSDEHGTATKSCLHHSTEPRSPWKDGGSGGGIPPADYRYETVYSMNSGIINGQSKFAYANAQCGAGTYARNGCGFIALYNAHQLLGKPRSLGDITDAFLYQYGTLLLGYWGVAPWHIGSYLQGQGFNCTGYHTYTALKNDLTDGDIIIFTIMNDINDISKGFHTVTAKYVNGQFIIYNRYGNIVLPYTRDSLLMEEDDKWIYGFIVRG